MSESEAPPLERYYAPTEVAHLLKVKHKTVLGWLRDSDHPLSGIKIGTMWRIPESNLRAYLKGNTQ